MRGIAGAILVSVWLGAGPALAEPEKPITDENGRVKLRVSRKPDGRQEEGLAYLIPQPFATVKAQVQQALSGPRLGGFQYRDDSAPLSKMEEYWVQVSANRQPEAIAPLVRSVTEDARALFGEALAAGVITSVERATFDAAILRQTEFDRDHVEKDPFFAQQVSRLAFSRRQGSSSRYHEDWGVVLDAAPMFGIPMTLVWFNGETTEVHHEMRIIECIPRAGCLLLPPHVEATPETIKDGPSPALNGALKDVATRMQALSAPALSEALMGYYGRHNSAWDRVLPDVASSQIVYSDVPEEKPPTTRLPADEEDQRDHNHADWTLLALPDGSVLASGKNTHRFIWRNGTVERLAAVEPLAKMCQMHLSPEGSVWAIPCSSRWAYGGDFVSWSPQSGQSKTYQTPDGATFSGWDVLSGQRVGFWNDWKDNAFFTLEPSGQWTKRNWNQNLRQDVREALDKAMPFAHSRRVHFGDGLLWKTDMSGYGIDPRTARVVKGFKTSAKDLFFGSHAANWGLAMIDSRYTYRVVDLTTGKLRFDVVVDVTSYRSPVARTAHGRLLAVSGRRMVLVVDMVQGKAVARLNTPPDHDIEAMAFSSAGDKLWVYMDWAGYHTKSMMVWDVPEPLTDTALGEDRPDQLRTKRD